MNDGVVVDTKAVAQFGLDLEQYVGLWLVDEARFGTLLEQTGKLDLASHIAANKDRDISAVSQRSQSADEVTIQVIDIQGTMTKRGSSLSGQGSMIRLREAVRLAANDDKIDAIMLCIDSPGGTVAGTADLAAEVRRAAAEKPTWAFVEDLTASAAYWVASQANRIVANNATAVIGSIGTFMALYDVSGAAAMQGIKAVVIRSGRLKGAGFPGTEVTEEQRQVWQEIVDKTQTEFTAGVATGRKLSLTRVQSLAEGRMWLAEDAQQLGLIDGIGSFDSVITDLAAESRRNRRNTMSENTALKAATWQELKNCCPEADAEFLGKQMDAQATSEDATKAWMGELQRRSEADTQARKDAEKAKTEAEKQTAEAKTEAEKAKAAKPGVEPLGGGSGKKEGTGDPRAEFEAAVDEKLKTGLSKPDAIKAVVKSNPELHAAFVETHNAEVGPSSYRR